MVLEVVDSNFNDKADHVIVTPMDNLDSLLIIDEGLGSLGARISTENALFMWIVLFRICIMDKGRIHLEDHQSEMRLCVCRNAISWRFLVLVVLSRKQLKCEVFKRI